MCNSRRIMTCSDKKVSVSQKNPFNITVSSVKRCLKKVIGNARLTFDELYLQVIVEVERTLTPGHLHTSQLTI